MAFPVVNENAMQANIKYIYDKKTNTSKLKERDYVFVLQPKADYQSSINLSTDVAGFGPTSLKRLHQITNFWYARLEQIEYKSFISCDYDRSHLRYNDKNLTLKLPLKMKSCTAEHGILFWKALF